jgi:hypothetical protein
MKSSVTMPLRNPSKTTDTSIDTHGLPEWILPRHFSRLAFLKNLCRKLKRVLICVKQIVFNDVLKKRSYNAINLAKKCSIPIVHHIWQWSQSFLSHIYIYIYIYIHNTNDQQKNDDYNVTWSSNVCLIKHHYEIFDELQFGFVHFIHDFNAYLCNISKCFASFIRLMLQRHVRLNLDVFVDCRTNYTFVAETGSAYWNDHQLIRGTQRALKFICPCFLVIKCKYKCVNVLKSK